MDESVPTLPASAVEIAPGIHSAYDLPDDNKNDETNEQVDTSLSLEELMAQMKSI